MGITDDAKAAAGKAAAGSKAAASAALSGSKAVAVGYWRGLTYPFKGMKFVYFQHPGLIRFWIFPILITALFLAAVTWIGLASYEGIAGSIWRDPTSAEVLQKTVHAERSKDKPRDKRIAPNEHDWIDEAGHWAHATFAIVILLTIWAVGLLVALFLTNVIAAPFNDFLSEEVERIRTGRPGPPFSLKVILRDLVRTVGLEALKLGLYALVMIPLFILSNLVPVVGPAIYTIFGFVFTAMYFAIDYIDWPASRRNRSVTYRFGLATTHFLPMFGFGTGVWLFLFIPFVNLLFMPAAVAGGTLLFLDLEGESEAALATGA
ncbi:MAG: EI24 domain-containing protein [Sandaracinaceae bacterium]|nr:EI24 domain-containing protein [Sandaracinaceae bacterium]